MTDHRITPLTELLDPATGAVVYWMQRSQRSHSSPALNYAIERANEAGVPILCYFALDPSYPYASDRLYTFMLEGLRDVATGLRGRGVACVVRHAPTVGGVVAFAREVNAGLVVTDESHLQLGRRRRAAAGARLAAEGRALVQVDNDLVVPVRALGREHYAARTIRPHLRRLGDEFLHRPGELTAEHSSFEYRSTVDLNDIPTTVASLPIDHSVPASATLHGGEREALARLRAFVTGTALRYDSDRNNAAIASTSGLSPYFRFGHLDPWTAAFAIQESHVPAEARDAFLEELLIRRELSANFCFYNPAYGSFLGAPEWARKTLEEHQHDMRPSLYTEDQLERGETADELWNAAQYELLRTGIIHNWVRMYWGKRIIEWTASAEVAFRVTLRLNNRYALDGRDDASFTNILWCYGRHDRPWPQRPVFGTVRSMSRAGADRKFKVLDYIDRVRSL